MDIALNYNFDPRLHLIWERDQPFEVYLFTFKTPINICNIVDHCSQVYEKKIRNPSAILVFVVLVHWQLGAKFLGKLLSRQFLLYEQPTMDYTYLRSGRCPVVLFWFSRHQVFRHPKIINSGGRKIEKSGSPATWRKNLWRSGFQILFRDYPSPQQAKLQQHSWKSSMPNRRRSKWWFCSKLVTEKVEKSGVVIFILHKDSGDFWPLAHGLYVRV